MLVRAIPHPPRYLVFVFGLAWVIQEPRAIISSVKRDPNFMVRKDSQ